MEFAINTNTEKKSFWNKLISSTDTENNIGRVYLFLAGVIYLFNGYIYFKSGFIGVPILIVNMVFATIFVLSAVLSFYLKFIQERLQLVLIASSYLILLQSIFESYTYKHDINHIIGLLIVYMVSCMPYKSSKSLNTFLIINFILVTVSTFISKDLLVSQGVIVLVFFTGGAFSMVSIGSRLRTQEKLRKNEEFFKNMFNESAGANFLADLSSLKTVSCNKKAIEMFETDTTAQLIGVDTQLFQVSTFSKEEMEQIKTEVADNWGWTREIEFKTLKGQIFWGALEYRIVQFQNEPFMQIRITDISDRKRLEHLLMAEKEVLELASQVEGLEKPITTLFANIEAICRSIKCAILFYDEEQESLSYGYSNSLNRTYINQIERYSMSVGTGLTNTAALTKKQVVIKQIDLTLLKRDNPRLMHLNYLEACYAYPILSEEQNVLGVLTVYFFNNVKSNGQEMEIITRIVNICRVLIEKEKVIQSNKDFVTTLQVKNEELRKTNEELDRFVYSTSHDLRVPLTNVMGLIDITNMTIQEEAPKKYLDMMRQSIVALDDVIRGILDYSRNSRSEINIEEVNIKEIVSKIKDMLKYYNGIDHIDFRIRIDETTPLYTDKHRLTVVLGNLISNAIKYYNVKEQHPYISIVAQVNMDRALIFIEDNGIGIPEEYQQKVFDMFYRASSQASGSGLGLYILKETITKLNGKISLISGHNIGSTFVIEIPNNLKEQENKAIA